MYKLRAIYQTISRTHYQLQVHSAYYDIFSGVLSSLNEVAMMILWVIIELRPMILQQERVEHTHTVFLSHTRTHAHTLCSMSLVR
jgi:hypothetical protein